VAEDPKSTDVRPAMRADASANRDKILDAARAALALSGEASMQSVAKAAGIGQGTLYRHFPTREALIMAVHRNDVRALVDSAPALLASLPAREAMRKWFDQLAAYGRIKHGLADALYSAMRETLSDEGYSSIVEAIGMLLAAGKEQGEVRTDIDAEEMLLLVGFLWRMETDDDWEVRASHLLDLVMDATRAPVS
jgi:AcrR family transcriptional regulator